MILAKVLAHGLEDIHPSVISLDQTGLIKKMLFIPKLFIGYFKIWYSSKHGLCLWADLKQVKYKHFYTVKQVMLNKRN